MLTEEQIKRLFTYCKKKGVRFYDLQTELVDHMATGIETEMDTYPERGFDEVANRIAGTFSGEWPELVKQTRKQLRREYLRLYFREFTRYFTWPGVALTALLSALVIPAYKYLMLAKFPGFFVYVLILAGASYAFTGRERTLNKVMLKKRQPLLSWNVLLGLQAVLGVIPVGYAALNIVTVMEVHAPELLYRIALFSSPLCFILALAWRHTYIRVMERITNNYPGAFGEQPKKSVVVV